MNALTQSVFFLVGLLSRNVEAMRLSPVVVEKGGRACPVCLSCKLCRGNAAVVNSPAAFATRRALEWSRRRSRWAASPRAFRCRFPDGWCHSPTTHTARTSPWAQSPQRSAFRACFVFNFGHSQTLWQRIGFLVERDTHAIKHNKMRRS